MIQKEKAKLVNTQKMMKLLILSLALPREASSRWKQGMEEKYSVLLQQKSMIGSSSAFNSSTCLLSPSLPKMQTRPIPIQTNEEMTIAILQTMVCQDFQQMLTIRTRKIPTKAKLVIQQRVITTQSCQQMTNSDSRLQYSSVEQVEVKQTMCTAAQPTSAANMQIRMLSTRRQSLNRYQRVMKQQLQTMKSRLIPPYRPITMYRYRKSFCRPRSFIAQLVLSIPRANQKGWNQNRSRLMKGMPAVQTTISQQIMMLPVIRFMRGVDYYSTICGQTGGSCLWKRVSLLEGSEQKVVISIVCSFEGSIQRPTINYQRNITSLVEGIKTSKEGRGILFIMINDIQVYNA